VSDRYSWAGGEELILRLGRNHPQQILILEPLFEEKNRTRRLIVDMMRALDGLGIGTALPDLPGTGESLRSIETVSFEMWRHAVTAAATEVRPVVIASLRGGALLDPFGAAKGFWRFAPEIGTRIVRDMERTRAAGGHDGLLAGHKLAPDFVEALRKAELSAHSKLRTVRLESDVAAADTKLEGSPLWRRAEPGEDAVLAMALAHDLAEWAKICVAS
jgi:hypothetical protein